MLLQWALELVETATARHADGPTSNESDGLHRTAEALAHTSWTEGRPRVTMTPGGQCAQYRNTGACRLGAQCGLVHIRDRRTRKEAPRGKATDIVPTESGPAPSPTEMPPAGIQGGGEGDVRRLTIPPTRGDERAMHKGADRVERNFEFL